MAKFKLYEDVLSRFWDRYFYEVEANTLEEAVEKIKDGKIDFYDSEQIYESLFPLNPEDNNGEPTREIYNEEDELMWDNTVF